MVCACDNPNSRGCPRTIHGIVMGPAQMLTQGFHNRTNLQNRDNAPVVRHGLPNGLQTNSYGARRVLGTIPNRKSIIKIIQTIIQSQIVWKSDPTGLAATLFHFQESVATKKPAEATTQTPQAT